MSNHPGLVNLDDPVGYEDDWDDEDRHAGQADYDDDGYYRQSTTACCPRETIPDSCSCPDGCACLCRDCDCQGWDEICRCRNICTCGGPDA